MSAQVIAVGLNGADSAAYDPLPEELLGAKRDAEAMLDIACNTLGFEGRAYVNSEATKKAILGALDTAACKVEAGESLLLTFSGHGSLVRNHHKGGFRNDRAWVLYDGLLLEDELYAKFCKFKSGVCIIGVSDCCQVRRALPDGGRTLVKAVSEGVRRENRRHWQDEACKAQAGLTGRWELTGTELKARVVHLYACRIHQQAKDGLPNSLFTGLLVDVLKSGAKYNDYRALRNRLRESMPDWQAPSVDFAPGGAGPPFTTGPVFSPTCGASDARTPNEV